MDQQTARRPAPGPHPRIADVHAGSNPPVAYITNMYGGTLWMAAWDPASKSFSFQQVDDLGRRGHSVVLELEHNRQRDRLYVTTGKPGHVSVWS